MFAEARWWARFLFERVLWIFTMKDER